MFTFSKNTRSPYARVLGNSGRKKTSLRQKAFCLQNIFAIGTKSGGLNKKICNGDTPPWRKGCLYANAAAPQCQIYFKTQIVFLALIEYGGK